MVPTKLVMPCLDTGWADSPGPALVCETNFGLALAGTGWDWPGPTLDLISVIFLSVNINWARL